MGVTLALIPAGHWKVALFACAVLHIFFHIETSNEEMKRWCVE
jgi:hypothetical protein